METFISKTSELRDELLKEEALGCSAEAWEARRAAFAGTKRSAVTPVTVSAQVPLQPYGQPMGFLRKLLRRIARKSVRWYTDELLRQQNEVNRGLLARIEALEERIRELEEENIR